MNKPKRGQTFTHDRFIDPYWKPTDEVSQWRNAPKAQMRVSSVQETKVYYTFADGKGLYVLDMDSFMAKFGGQL